MAAATVVGEGFAPESVYATYTDEERAASDRMEAVYNHERTFDVLRILEGQKVTTSLRFSSCDTLRSLAKIYGREVEDIEAGDILDDVKGRRLKLAKARLHDVECEEEFRGVLAETWQASDTGTHCYTAFEARGGLLAVVHHGAAPPSFALAVLLDYENHLLGEPTVLEWPDAQGKRTA